MTSPLRRGVEPGESEFSHGKGLLPPEVRGYVPTNRVLLNAMYQTDSANPDATIEGTFVANPTKTHIDPETGIPVLGDLDEYATPRVREIGVSSSSGQHKRIDVGRYNKGHFPDGQNDGLGQAWRDSLPPNPVT